MFLLCGFYVDVLQITHFCLKLQSQQELSLIRLLNLLVPVRVKAKPFLQRFATKVILKWTSGLR